MKALADADFLVALAKEDDSNHEKALAKLADLADVVVFITPFTIPEAVTVLSYKVSQSVAKEFLTSLRQKNFIELPMEKIVSEEADKIFLSRKEKGISWIDCFNTASVKIYKLDGILSFDKFYKKVGILNLI
ncbi:MAG: type II toxin-antitoxin system VapC family toxin [bacterium]|nr:type II toxin-antitoxin system VapC family toxin [bacterium]